MGEIPWMTCNCKNGTARGGKPICYHTAAVLLFLEKELEEESEAETPL